MDSLDLIIRSRRVVLPETIEPATIHIAGGVISAIGGFDEISTEIPLIDAGEAVVMPGLVDAHVHINEPGRTALGRFYDGNPRGGGGRRDDAR